MGQIIGIDIGGTFTDLILVDPLEGTLVTHKVSTTPDDPTDGLIRGLEESELSSIEAIIHGTTVATNAILERKGARCGLLATRGFRDILELRRRDRPHAYGLTGSFQPLIPRNLRVEVDERISASGDILTPLDEQTVLSAAERLVDEGVEGFVVAYFNSYANPVHELRTREILTSAWPSIFVTCSAEILPVYREFERASTAAVNAYVQPLVSRYLGNVRDSLDSSLDYRNGLLVMQSNGGMLDADAIADMPVQTVMSGPAAGVMGAARLAGYHGVDRLITYDLGGTSLDVSLVVDGEPATSSVTEIEFGIPVGTSMIDVRAIGAGGGSIARVDEGGILQIGPESAGADPGPVCYASGGADPTLTDALVVLGLINPDRSITGSRLDVTGAGKVISSRVAEPLDLSLEQAAEAIVTVATNRISGSLRRISIDRGHDPRDFSLFAFGGGGPLFASTLLRELGTRDALIPTFPGIASAWGCAVADVRRDFVRMLNKRLTDIDFDDVAATIDEHSSRGRQFIDSSGIPVDRIDIVIEADAGFEGQTHVIRTPLSADALDDDDVRRRFRAAYDRHYGVEQIEFEGLADLMDEIPIRILNVRTSVLGVRSALSLKELIDPPVSSLSDASLGDRGIYFEGRMRPCPTYDRLRLPWDARIEGPAVVEQEDSTFWIEPGVSGHVLEGGTIRLQVAT